MRQIKIEKTGGQAIIMDLGWIYGILFRQGGFDWGLDPDNVRVGPGRKSGQEKISINPDT